MPNYEFSAEEIDAFASQFDRSESWIGWRRRRGDHGEDVIEVDVDDPRSRKVLIAKTKDSYIAKGLAGWGLTVCDSFHELLNVIAQMTRQKNQRGSSAQTAWRAA